MTSKAKSKKSDFNDLLEKLLGTESSNGFKAYHFFKRDYLYICYGVQAVYIADQYYQTRSVIKTENGKQSVTVGRKTLSHICASLLDQHFMVKIWGKPEKSASSPWEIIAEGKPGNYKQLEEEVGAVEKDATSIKFVAAVKLWEEKVFHVGIVLISTDINAIIFAEFDDTEHFSK